MSRQITLLLKALDDARNDLAQAQIDGDPIDINDLREEIHEIRRQLFMAGWEPEDE
jgi:hypothetical protein